MRVPKYRWFLWAAFVAALLFFTIQMRILPGSSPRTAQRYGSAKGFQLLDAVWQLIRDDYLDVREAAPTAEGAYRGIVNSLDVLSGYLNKELTARYLARGTRDKDPGLVVFKRYGTFPVVAAAIEDSPARKAGLKIGDLLSAIGHRSTLSMSLAEVNLLLKGPDDGPVSIKVLRGNETLEFSVGRAVLFTSAYQLERESGLPVLRIRYFSPSLTDDIKNNLVRGLKAQKKPLILDLRDCAEGDFEEARTLTNLFLQAENVGSLEKKGGIKETVACPEPAEIAGLPVVIWVNQATMGAAEFVAGVLQELRKVKVIGIPTPGIVAQGELFSLKDESSILLTTGIFALPSGRSLWGQGLTPDVAVTVKDQSEKVFIEKTLPLVPKL
jgi:C-terminal peptidase prc